MKKSIYILIIIIMAILLMYHTESVLAYDPAEGTNQPVIRYVKETGGDKICFEVVVKTATTPVQYRTVGWTVSVNGYKIIYKYPEIPDFDFTFYMRDIDSEFKRQYGESSVIYSSIKKIMYETGGEITFDAINTVIKDNLAQGSINDGPVYGKSAQYNYTGKVFTDLQGIQNAENWDAEVKNVDLPKYFGISYNFSKQPLENTYESKENSTDLYISNISPLEYNEKTKVVTVITAGNKGKTDCGPDNTVNIKFKADGKVYTREADIGAGKEIIVPFVWTTNGAGKVTLEAEINYDKKHSENNYDDNKMTETAVIKQYRSEFSDDAPKVNILPAPQMESNNYIKWKEWRFVKWDIDGKAVYEQKDFWVNLEINAAPGVSVLKSGYGFFMDAATKITTNYDKPEFIIAPQRIQVYVSEKQFRDFFGMDIKSGDNGFDTNWQIPVNPNSVYGYRKHYIPVWFPDKTYYEMNVMAIDSYCPGGALSSVTQSGIYINGNLYEDDKNGGYK